MSCDCGPSFAGCRRKPCWTVRRGGLSLRKPRSWRRWPRAATKPLQASPRLLHRNDRARQAVAPDLPKDIEASYRIAIRSPHGQQTGKCDSRPGRQANSPLRGDDRHPGSASCRSGGDPSGRCRGPANSRCTPQGPSRSPYASPSTRQQRESASPTLKRRGPTGHARRFALGLRRNKSMQTADSDYEHGGSHRGCPADKEMHKHRTPSAIAESR